MKHLRVKTGIVVPSRVRPSFMGIDRTVSTRLAPSYEALVEAPRCTSNPTCVERGLKPCHYCRTQREGERYWER